MSTGMCLAELHALCRSSRAVCDCSCHPRPMRSKGRTKRRTPRPVDRSKSLRRSEWLTDDDLARIAASPAPEATRAYLTALRRREARS